MYFFTGMIRGVQREGIGTALVLREDIEAVFTCRKGIGAAFVCRDGRGLVFVHKGDAHINAYIDVQGGYRGSVHAQG